MSSNTSSNNNDNSNHDINNNSIHSNSNISNSNNSKKGLKLAGALVLTFWSGKYARQSMPVWIPVFLNPFYYITQPYSSHLVISGFLVGFRFQCYISVLQGLRQYHYFLRSLAKRQGCIR